MKAVRWLFPLSLILMFLSLGIRASSQFPWLKLLQGGEVTYQVFLELCLPRTLVTALVVGVMSLSGLLIQTVTQNNYAAPSTVRTVEAAQLGMLTSLLFFPKVGLAQKMSFAFIFLVLMTLFFIKVVRRLSFKEKWMLPLAGLIYGGMIRAVVEMVAYRFDLV